MSNVLTNRPKISHVIKVIQSNIDNIRKTTANDEDALSVENTIKKRRRTQNRSLSTEELKIYFSLVSDLNKENYVLLEILGKGEFGVVYKAFDKEREKIMALKIIEMDKEVFLTEEYLDEGLILKKLSELDKNKFLEFYGAFTCSDEKPEKLWLAMQCGEAALSDLLEYRKKYTDPEIIFIISTIIDLLNEAKIIGISHGDIKLADVAIVEENGIKKYKLIDFGMGIQFWNKNPNLTDIDATKK